MKAKDQRPTESRIEYRWRVDVDAGFEKTALIYDKAGRLVGADYQYARRASPPVPPTAAGA